MNRTVLVLMMAVTVEALVEYAKTFGKAILEKQWKTAATQAGAVALGVSLCFSAGADFYAALGVSSVSYTHLSARKGTGGRRARTRSARRHPAPRRGCRSDGEHHRRAHHGRAVPGLSLIHI